MAFLVMWTIKATSSKGNSVTFSVSADSHSNALDAAAKVISAQTGKSVSVLTNFREDLIVVSKDLSYTIKHGDVTLTNF